MLPTAVHSTSVVALILLVTCAVESARILGVFPLPSKSHYFLGNALMRALAEKGHDVTVISTFGEKNPPKGGSYTDVLLSGMLDNVEERRKELNMYEVGDMSPFLNLPLLAYVLSEIGELTLKHENVQRLIHSGEKFDVVIVEQFFADSYKVLAGHFGGIQILFQVGGANIWVNPLVGNPAPLSYIPGTFLSFSGRMSFTQRLTNVFMYVLNLCVHHLYLYPQHNKIAQKYVPNVPDLHDVLYNLSLVLLNSHPSLNQAVPHVPNMVEIGGFHVKPPQKLPSDLQAFLDGAKDGVIYFSMGSNLRSADLPVDKRDALLKVFSKLKQKILWKWEDDVLPGQPQNVKLGKWLPQNDILAHPNVKLFITHGGLLSTTETVYHGIPILAIPIYGDQKLNAQTSVSKGYGLSVPYKELSEEKLTENLHEILNNPKYYENAKIQSKIFHDRQVSPTDTAIYWVEYVIRHQGASHLRVAGVDLPWYKYLLLDVIAVLVLVTSFSFVICCFGTKKVYAKMCKRKAHQKIKKT